MPAMFQRLNQYTQLGRIAMRPYTLPRGARHSIVESIGLGRIAMRPYTLLRGARHSIVECKESRSLTVYSYRNHNIRSMQSP